MRLAPLACLLLAALPASSQDSDTILTRDSPRFTVVSQVSDPAESAAFLRALQATNPTGRHQLASSFIDLHPRSILLAQAFDLAAKASIDLNAFPRALEEGRFSLRLLPENAPLLTLLANIEARDPAKHPQALTDARNALDYIDQFESEPKIASELRASAWYAIGLVYASRGLKSPAQPADLQQAMAALDQAAACNPADPEVFFLRGVTALALHNKDKAARDLTFAAKSASAVAPRAQALLKGSLSSAPPEIDHHLLDRPPQKPTAAIRAGYAGPSACAGCHRQQFETWSKTGMAKMLQPYNAENIFGDFSPTAAFPGASIQFGANPRPFMEIPDASGNLHRFHVDYTIGSKWQQAYATQLPDGRLQVMPIQYNRLSKSWINYWSIIDPPGSPRAVIQRFDKMLPETNYQRNCAICHTSQLRASAFAQDSFTHANFLQPGVDCEMCHGPSALHVKQAHAGKIEAADLPVNFNKIDHREGVRICGQCHRQSSTRHLGSDREMNFSSTTASFVQENVSRPYDTFSRRAFYADGRFRETTFIVEAFTRSACYRNGTAQCASCHAPHVPDPEHNPTSLKHADEPNELCLNCHSTLRGQIKRHTRHAPDSEASQCVSCHMPRIVNALMFKARSHQIEIPTLDLTERFGQAESPNACLLCHTGRDAAWLARQLKVWR